MTTREDGPGPFAAEWVRVVRTRPGMFVGNVGEEGLHRTLFRLVVGSLSETAAGFGREVRIAVRTDGSVEVADDGRGLSPVGPASPLLQAAFTEHHTRPNAPGREWLDYLTANALSEWVRVESRYDGRLYRQEFRQGVPVDQPRLAGPAAGCGLSVTFRPDPEVFGETRFSEDTIRDRLREYAFVHSGVRLVWTGPTAGPEAFEFTDGIRSFVEQINEGWRPLHPDVVVIRGEDRGVWYEVGLQWCEEEGQAGGAFVNGERTREFGGTQVTGMRAAVTRALNGVVRTHLPNAPDLSGSQAREGLTAVVSVRLADPTFLGAMRTQLCTPEAQGVVEAGVVRALGEYLRAHPGTAEKIIRAAVAPPAGRVPMTAGEWPSCADPWRMLRHLDATGSRRKTALLASALCRCAAGENRADRKVSDAIAGHADGLLGRDDLLQSHGARSAVRRVAAAVTAPDATPFTVARFMPALSALHPTGGAPPADLIRDIFGNPFFPAAVDPSWLTSAVVDLAWGVYESQAFDRLPVLADALEDAGCSAPDILAHCRGEGPHVRGCWVVDLVLKKS